MTVNNEKELGQALKNNVDEIEIDCDLAHHVIKIKGKGKIAWGVCAGAITVAITSIITTAGSGGTASPITVPVAFLSSSVAGTTLGIGTATAAVAIGAAGGGIATLNKLRQYRMKRISKNHVILYRK